MNNGNGFLAPALGIAMWRSMWHNPAKAEWPIERVHRDEVARAPYSRRYYAWLDGGMRWQYDLDSAANILVKHLHRLYETHSVSDTVARVREVFHDYAPNAWSLMQVPARFYSDVLRRVGDMS